MLIYTSYFAQVRNLPSDIVPISIAAKQVPGWRYPVYKALAPTYNILYDYKRDGDKDHYVAAYLKDVLRYLSPEKVVADLEKLSDGKDIALICYEKSGSFCRITGRLSQCNRSPVLLSRQTRAAYCVGI